MRRNLEIKFKQFALTEQLYSEYLDLRKNQVKYKDFKIESHRNNKRKTYFFSLNLRINWDFDNIFRLNQ